MLNQIMKLFIGILAMACLCLAVSLGVMYPVLIVIFLFLVASYAIGTIIWEDVGLDLYCKGKKNDRDN